MLISSHFKAAWWLTNRHMQTIAAKWLRRNEKLNTLIETIELPDGDFIDIAWTEKPQADNSQPIVVILHGLEGSVDSHYVKGMLATLKQKGWIGVLMHFRGCSGRANRQAAAYHSGDTRDITYLATMLKNNYPHCPLFLIGFSLGGNVVARYIAHNVNNPFTAATIVCAPLHLASCSQRINQGFSKLYQYYLVNMLKNSTQLKIDSQLITTINTTALKKVKTMKEFDQLVTAPINGFKDADDYYHQMSGLNNLTSIDQQCLIIHAIDDPFLNHQEIISNELLPQNITFELTEKGGHMGFITGNNPLKPIYWLEERIPTFIEQFL